MSKKPIEERFWEKVERGGPDECWEWTASMHVSGYGQFWDGEKRELAHRFSYMMHNDEDLSDRCVCHRCDNPRCVNPRHLFAGTQKDNVRDMVRKGRRYVPDVSGEKNGHSKLTVAQVKELRKRRDKGEKLASLAAEYDVSMSLISQIALRRIWSHV